MVGPAGATSFIWKNGTVPVAVKLTRAPPVASRGSTPVVWFGVRLLAALHPSSPLNTVSVPGGTLVPVEFFHSTEYELPIRRLDANQAVAPPAIVVAVSRPSGTTIVCGLQMRASMSVALLLAGVGSLIPAGTAMVAVLTRLLGFALTVPQSV